MLTNLWVSFMVKICNLIQQYNIKYWILKKLASDRPTVIFNSGCYVFL